MTRCTCEMADEAIAIGPAASAESYLVIEQASSRPARRAAPQAVHPGFGFLAENPSFVEAWRRPASSSSGPRTGAIAAMGDKIESKRLAAGGGRQHRAGPHGADRGRR